MRIIAMLNPTNKRGTKTEYTKLRKFLITDGYIKWGQELYMRITPNRKTAEKHLRRIQEYAPKTGEVRILKLTEHQFESICYLAGEPDLQEKVIGKNSIIML